MQNGAKYYNNRVNWDRNTLEDLQQIIDSSKPVSRDYFTHKVDRDDRIALELNLGYVVNPGRGKGLTMTRDYNVTYHKSNIRGTDVYYLRHSAIEYIFVMFPGITYAEEPDNL